MNFDESVKYLLSLGNEVLAMKLGLENITKLLDALGNPQNNYLKIQIAGTNGKGSTAAILESICTAANIKIGTTTSPHLISIVERVRLNGKEIAENDFARLATKVRKTAEKLVENSKVENRQPKPENLNSLATVPTYFEQVTAIALLAFAEAGIELAILETGLGGRFDATTAANAEIAAITPIDLDHQNILGNSLAEIAAEKAAIIRKSSRVFIAPQKKTVEKVILEKCKAVGVTPVLSIPDVNLIEKLDGNLSYLNFKTPAANYKVDFAMQGKHQWSNADLAIRIAESLREFGFKISKQAFEIGLETAKHKGRLEFYKGILFDGAHNISGAKALREYLDEFINQPIIMIFGAMRDKDLTETAKIIFPKVEKLILTRPDNPRSFETDELLQFISNETDKNKIYQIENVEEALKTAQKIKTDKDLILVTGSLYLVGEAQKILNEREN